MSESHEQPSFVAPEPADLAPLFPGYEIHRLIATGGMGAVYQAVQKSLDRDVALKILPMEFSKDAAFCAGFEAEAKAMARLNHPNLIGVYDFGEVGGMLFIIMEYVPGHSVYHAAYGKAIDPKEVIRLVTAICNGLAHAHDNGIIHRDIKPSNILLDLNAEPKIGDFGLARPIERKVQEGEEIFGTPHYTAPEVVNSPHSVDSRADIFSVGVLLYELLTGKLPDPNPRPASTVVRCDIRFDAIIRKATQPLAAARYSSASEIAKDLEAIVPRVASTSGPKVGAKSGHKGSHSPVGGPPRPGTPVRGYAKYRQKKSSNSTLLGFLLLAAAAAFAAYLYYGKYQSPEVVPPVEVPASKDTGKTSAQDGSTDSARIEIGNSANNPTPNTTAVEPAVIPDSSGSSSNTHEPKFDVSGFFLKARKAMKEKSKLAVAAHQTGLKDNFFGFEKSLIREAKKLPPSKDRVANAVEPAIEAMRSAGANIPEKLTSNLADTPELEKIRLEFYQRQIGLDDALALSLTQLSSQYVLGLEMQIERLKPDNDVGAINLIVKEIANTKDDDDYFPGLILDAPSDTKE